MAVPIRPTVQNMTRSIMTFTEAIDDAKSKGYRRSVLLGNGFSMAYDTSVFGYESLAKEATLAGLSVPKARMFKLLGSSNFEVVVDLLRASAKMQRLYGGDETLARSMLADARVVRNGLADVLADRHPANNLVLPDAEVAQARVFLSNFRQIYTLSYDLLLYWVVNRTGVGPRVPKADGFEYATAEQDGGLIWKSNPTQGRQRIFFLHGALHLFVESDKRLHKLSYTSDGPLVSALRSRLRSGKYPLVVTEGKRAEKEARIDSSSYLRTAHRRLANIDGALFVHGVSMSQNDDHVFEPLTTELSDVKALYVGIHGRTTSGAGRVLAERAIGLADERRASGGKKLRVKFYDANSARVWR
jgi:hypothetical protein